MSITKEQFTQLIGGFGFETFDETALPELNGTLGKMVEKSVGQTGGRVSMPSEYFGVAQNFYTSNPAGTNPSMGHPTNSIARPSLPETFPHVGGSNPNSDAIFDKLLKTYRQTGGGKKLRLKKEQKVQSKHIFQRLIEKLFADIRKVAKKTKLLKGAQVQKASKKQK
jgi:hypothetical protein